MNKNWECVIVGGGVADLSAALPQVAIALGSGHLAGVAVARELLLGRTAQTPG